jgi:hypothetical protein
VGPTAPDNRAWGKTFSGCYSLSQQYKREGAEVLDSVVTSDEILVHYLTPESKRASEQWKHKDSSPPKKVKTIFLAGMIIATVFWDSKGGHLDFLAGQKTIIQLS